MSARPPIWDRPRIGYVLTLIVVSLGAAINTTWRLAEVSARSSLSEQRIAALEAYARTCKP
jgi:hypothetical protein